VVSAVEVSMAVVVAEVSDHSNPPSKHQTDIQNRRLIQLPFATNQEIES